MKHSTSIEWTHAPGYKGETWNPVTGCNKISAGCAHCYAADIAKRFWGDRPFSDVQFHKERLQQPLRWKKPRMVFVNSMSDLFHDAVTDEQLDKIFAVMALTPQHIYQILTKRPERMLEYFSVDVKRLHTRWVEAAIAIEAWEDIGRVSAWIEIVRVGFPLPNVWLGVTVENQKAADERIPLLLRTPAAVRFLSCEPLLEDVNIISPIQRYWETWIDFEGKPMFPDLTGDCESGLDQIIIGGESGTKARPFDIEWGRSLIRQCKDAHIPVFMKQLGSKPKIQVHTCHEAPLNWSSFGSTGKGGNLDEWPEDLRIREWPKVLSEAG